MVAKKQQAAPVARAGRSIKEHCARWGYSVGTFFNEQKAGRGPRVMKIGRRSIITDEAEADWKRAREREQRPRTEAAE